MLAEAEISPEQAIEDLDRLRYVWRGDGVEFRVLRRLGELQIDGTQAAAEFRLWDVAGCRRLARKRYRQTGEDPTVIARRIADDIMAAFIGVRGVSSTEIAFVSDRSGSTEIYVMGADGEKPRPATSNRSINSANSCDA